MFENISEWEHVSGALCGDGVEEEDIAKAERLLDVCFASDYHEYLTRLGTGFVNGHELTGLGSDRRVDVVEVTLEARCRFGGMEGWYVIEEVNIDGIVAWQNSAGEVAAGVFGERLETVSDSLAGYVRG